MTQSARGSQSAPALKSALTWLDAPQAGDPLHDLAPLRHHLRAIITAATDPFERLKILKPFQDRADTISNSLKALLHESTLPLSQRLRLIAQGLTDIHGLLASTVLDCVRQLTSNQLTATGRSLANFCGSILHNLALQQEVALLVATTPPADLWRHAQIAHSLLQKCPPDDALGPEQLLKGMLALAAAQPETLVGHEVAFLIDYLRGFPLGVTIDRQPSGPLDSWYWLDEKRSLPPVAVTRRPPPASAKTLYFCCAALAQTADEHLRRLAAGENPVAIGLPPSLANEDCRAVLGRTQARWASPPRRRHHHRPSKYAVEICPELDQLWDLLRIDGDGEVDQDPIPLTKWMVLNESPGGFAMTHLSGSISGLVSGGALGLRTSPERPWNICLVRWARSDHSAHVELGLELIAPSAAPVQIVRRDNLTESRLTPAFLLRSPNGNGRHEALLASRSGTSGRPFTMIAEGNGNLQLTECQVQRLALQTSSVEMLEFMRDFSPSL